MKQDYIKQKVYVKGWLAGKGYHTALMALDFALQYHTGKRKDGDEEFSHQISQAALAITLSSNFLFPEDVFITIFLHDTTEDYGVENAIMTDKFGARPANAIRLMTKVSPDMPKQANDYYYANMVSCPIASVCKGLDRVHNLMTMVDAFKPEKQVEYVIETTDFVVPMLKKARKIHTSQSDVYENIKFIIMNQVRLYLKLNEHLVK